MNKELRILKWVAIALACLSTVFTLVIVGSHLMGRLVGLGKVGVIGSVGAELMAIVCAWLSAAERKIVAGVAMLCAVILTAVLLINASVALDLNWQEAQLEKSQVQKLERQKIEQEEARKTLAVKAELAGQLAQFDKRLGREFLKDGTGSANNAKPVVGAASLPSEPESSDVVDVAKLGFYERYGLTTVPLFLALLTVIALGLAAHTKSAQSPIETEADFPEFLHDADLRESYRQPKFQLPRSYTDAPKKATQARDVATRAAGLVILRQALKDLASALPGRWFKADVKADHVLIRLCHREGGRELTHAKGKFTLLVLDDAQTMEFAEFRKRLKNLLEKKSIL